MSGRRVAKRACDGCKIRKIKCSEDSPCHGCLAAGIACTFVKSPGTRGPRRLRKSTLQEIQQTQQPQVEEASQQGQVEHVATHSAGGAPQNEWYVGRADKLGMAPGSTPPVATIDAKEIGM